MKLDELRQQWNREKNAARLRFGYTRWVRGLLAEDDRVIDVELLAGTHIKNACEELVEITKRIGKPIRFDFNGKTLCTGDGSADALVRHYQGEDAQ